MRTRCFSMAYVACLAVGWALVGCQDQPAQGKAMVTVLVGGPGAKELGEVSEGVKAEVPLDAIESLKITVTEISLDFAGSGGPSGNEGEGEDQGSKVVVFTGEKEIDIRDLAGISELMSSAELDPGTYTKIRLSVKDPKLVLTADPEIEIIDIHLTAGGQLFVSESFDLPEGQMSLVVLEFESIHLVENGNGGYVWTPQLRAEVSVTDAAVQVTGEIQSIDTEAQVLTVTVADSGTEVDMNYAGVQVFLATDTDTPTGTAADLAVGQQVVVDGMLTVSGPMTAETIRIVS